MPLLFGSDAQNTFQAVLNAIFGARDTCVTKAAEVVANLATILGYKTDAETAAGTATTQAGIATTQAGDAAKSAGQAETWAGVAEGHAGDAANHAKQAASGVYAQRVLGVSAADWFDLSAAPGALALVTEDNCALDPNDGTVQIVDDQAPWTFKARIDLTADPAQNPLYDPDRLSFRLHDDGPTIPPGDGSVTLELLNSSLVVIETVALAAFYAPGGVRVYGVSDLDPGAARYVDLTITGQGAYQNDRIVSAGEFGAGSFLRSGYLDQAAAALAFRQRARLRVTRALPYTLGADDDRVVVELTGSGDLTLPQSAAMVGRDYVLLNGTGSAVRAAGGSGVTVHSAGGALELAAGGTLRARCTASQEFWISGDLS